jgi:hypothetical protein
MDHYVALAWQGLMKKSDGSPTKAYNILSTEEKEKIEEDLKGIKYNCLCTSITCR